VKIESNIKSFLKSFSDIQSKHIPAAELSALNKTAFKSMEMARQKVKTFHGKDLTRAVRYKKATAQRRYAELYVDDYFPWKENALVTLERGGDRERKGTERAMIRAGYLKPYEILTPDDGKVSGSAYNQIISQFQMNYKAGYDANETKASFARKKAKRKTTAAKNRYMIATSSGYLYAINPTTGLQKKKTGLAPGVYVSMIGIDFKPIRILKISRRPSYLKRWDFKSIINQVYAQNFERDFFVELTKRVIK
jgi:hypothetical protein